MLCRAMKPLAVKELASALRCDRTNITRLVDRAFAHGYVKRRAEEEDGRVTMIELTPAGERLAKTFLQVLEAQTARLRATWPAKQGGIAVRVPVFAL